MTDAAPADAWTGAMRALSALAVDPAGLGGMVVRARMGPVLQALRDHLRALPLPMPQRRIHADLSDSQLFGGPDIAATLAAGRLVMDAGIAARPALLVLPMAERCPPYLAARLAQVLEAGAGHALVLIDEGAAPDEAAPAALAERLAFGISLEGMPACAIDGAPAGVARIAAARRTLPGVRLAEGQAETMTALAARFGIDSLRAPILALRAARALAALAGRDRPSEEDLRAAAELVYPSRATLAPEPPAEDDAPAPPPDPGEARDGEGEDGVGRLEDMLVAAVATHLPADLLLGADGARAARGVSAGAGAGARRRGNRRGRPLAPRRGRVGIGARIDLVATLRAAAPWQALRRGPGTPPGRVLIHPDDIHLRRTEERSDRLIVFCVDASGSAAVARLAEAKGAVELVLAEAYAKRDQVALVSFRGRAAELLLPPTRSLVQAKKRLAALPGGGGTPLAAGLQRAAEVADHALRHGLTPMIALLTDGRANVALDGSGGRMAAAEDARAHAQVLGARGIAGVVIDTAARPGKDTAEIAAAMGARHVGLPRADAAGISSAVTGALAG